MTGYGYGCSLFLMQTMRILVNPRAVSRVVDLTTGGPTGLVFRGHRGTKWVYDVSGRAEDLYDVLAALSNDAEMIPRGN